MSNRKLPLRESKQPEAPVTSSWAPPDGGIAWFIPIAGFFIIVATGPTAMGFGVIMDEMTEYFDTSNTAIAWIGSINMSTGLLSGTLIGVLTEKYGTRRMAVAGGLMAAAGTLLSSIVGSLYALYITYGVMIGFGSSLSFNCALISASRYFTSRRSRAHSIVLMGVSASTFVWPPVCEYLLRHYYLHGTLLIFSACTLHIVPMGLLLKDTPPSRAKMKEYRDVDTLAMFKQLLNVSILKDVGFVLFLLASMFMAVGHLIPIIYTTFLAQSRHHTRATGAYLVSIIGITGGACRLMFGVLGDKFNRSVLFSLTLTLSAMTQVLAVFFADEYYQFVIFAVLFGVWAAGYIVLSGPIIVDTLGIETVAKGTGFFLVCLGIGTLISQSSAGMLLDATGSASSVFLLGGAGQAVGAAFSVLSYVVLRKRRKHDTRNQQDKEVVFKESRRADVTRDNGSCDVHDRLTDVTDIDM